jgi:hypothetical protein
MRRLHVWVEQPDARRPPRSSHRRPTQGHGAVGLRAADGDLEHDLDALGLRRARWSSDIADITPLDRIVFPTVLDTSPPTPVPSTSVYDILEVHEIGRREGFKIIAVRRADVS